MRCLTLCLVSTLKQVHYIKSVGIASTITTTINSVIVAKVQSGSFPLANFSLQNECRLPMKFWLKLYVELIVFTQRKKYASREKNC